jgi:hypothetical protein
MTASKDDISHAADPAAPASSTSLDAARTEAEASRARLRNRLGVLRARTRPAALIDEAKTIARDRALTLAASAISQPRARTAIAASAVGAGLAYLFRKPLLKALAKRLKPESSHD